MRRIRMFPRSNVPVQVTLDVDPDTNQAVTLIDSGVNLIVDGIRGMDMGPLRVESIDVSADRLVIWTQDVLDRYRSGRNAPGGGCAAGNLHGGQRRLRQGDAVIHADRMYYNVNRRVGIVLDAELLTPVPQYQGKVRLKTKILRQLGPNQFFAENASSPPAGWACRATGWKLGTSSFQDTPPPAESLHRRTGPRPRDGRADRRTRVLRHGRNNFLYLRRIPVFWWPTVRHRIWKTPRSISAAFGSRTTTSSAPRSSPTGITPTSFWASRTRPRELAGTWAWTISANGDSAGHDLPLPSRQLPGDSRRRRRTGRFLSIDDRGLDNLGGGVGSWSPRRIFAIGCSGSIASSFAMASNLPPKRLDQRPQLPGRILREGVGRAEGRQHRPGVEAHPRQHLLEHYGRQADQRLFHADRLASPGRSFLAGQSLFGDRLTWYEHTSLGYADSGPPRCRRIRPTRPCSGTSTGRAPARPIRFRSRACVSPLGTSSTCRYRPGRSRSSPTFLGEAAYWGQDKFGEDVGRIYGQTGIRASLPMWKVDPTVKSDLWNLNGLAHKIVFDVEASIADANRDMNRFPLYDPLDDDAIEPFAALRRDRLRRQHPHALRRTGLRPPKRPGRLGHLAQHRGGRRPVRRAPRRAEPLADQARPGRK